MISRVFTSVLLVLGCVSGMCQLPAPTAISDLGYSSCSRRSCLFVPDDKHPQTYRQGDLSYTVAKGGEFTLYREQKMIFSTILKDLSASVFVAWSEREDWFAITWSNGGASGAFDTRVFQIAGDRVNEADSAKVAFSDFRRRHSCWERGENLQAYGWDDKTGALVLVTSVYPASDCGKDSGHTEAYLVDASGGVILKHLSFREFNAYAKSHPQ